MMDWLTVENVLFGLASAGIAFFIVYSFIDGDPLDP
jgi:hypothetical protein